ncbi:hypothetical protein JTB14_019667 [Gonioctena quinquepunctata]|nr:hypothetical protein JTB14_019667 [Gonioctena quinquepunctata]
MENQDSSTNKSSDSSGKDINVKDGSCLVPFEDSSSVKCEKKELKFEININDGDMKSDIDGEANESKFNSRDIMLIKTEQSSGEIKPNFSPEFITDNGKLLHETVDELETAKKESITSNPPPNIVEYETDKVKAGAEVHTSDVTTDIEAEDSNENDFNLEGGIFIKSERSIEEIEPNFTPDLITDIEKLLEEEENITSATQTSQDPSPKDSKEKPFRQKSTQNKHEKTHKKFEKALLIKDEKYPITDVKREDSNENDVDLEGALFIKSERSPEELEPNFTPELITDVKTLLEEEENRAENITSATLTPKKSKEKPFRFSKGPNASVNVEKDMERNIPSEAVLIKEIIEEESVKTKEFVLKYEANSLAEENEHLNHQIMNIKKENYTITYEDLPNIVKCENGEVKTELGLDISDVVKSELTEEVDVKDEILIKAEMSPGETEQSYSPELVTGTNTDEPSTSLKRKWCDSDGETSYHCSTDEDESGTHDSSLSSTSSYAEDVSANVGNIKRTWTAVSGLNKKIFPFTATPRIKIHTIPLHCTTPYFCFCLMVDDEIISLMTEETNKNACRDLSSKTLTESSRLKAWKETNTEEMKKLLGLLIWMGLKKLPSTNSYWSSKPLYKNNIASRAMSRNRFELLLRFWRFDDDTEHDNGDRIIKMRNLIDLLNARFKKFKEPGKYLAIDETTVLFCGLRQYDNKRHNNGVKLSKICDTDAYTYKVSVHQGKQDKNVALQLSDDYLGHGRLVVTGSRYTSLELADDLLNKNTHLIGTLRKNRKGLPEDVISTNLKKGEITGRESSGIVVLKWKDQRDVLALSTCHTLQVEKNRKNEEIRIPKLILDYNRGKGGIDLYDQLSSSSTPVRESLRWYHKIAMELLLKTAMVNAFVLFKKIRSSTINVVEFREKICETLLQIDFEEHKTGKSCEGSSEHELAKSVERDGRNRKVRRRCIHCYETLRQEGKNYKEARDTAKRVITMCAKCPSNPTVCMECFSTIHVNL